MIKSGCWTPFWYSNASTHITYRYQLPHAIIPYFPSDFISLGPLRLSTFTNDPGKSHPMVGISTKKLGSGSVVASASCFSPSERPKVFSIYLDLLDPLLFTFDIAFWTRTQNCSVADSPRKKKKKNSGFDGDGCRGWL